MTAFSDLSFSYPGGSLLFHQFSLEIPPNARLALMGASGCGKTTLLRILMGLEKPTGGAVLQPPRPVAAVFQEDRLLSHLTVLNNAALASKDTEKAAALLKRAGLGEVLHAFPDALSGGMKRRVAVVRALCTPSSMLVLDEPFNGLDENTRILMASLISETWHSSLLLVTHQEEEARLLDAKIHRLS